MSLNGVEAFWIGTNLLTTVGTVYALRETFRDRHAVRLLNGAARAIIARGNVRRETVRLYVQLVFLVIALPGIFDERDTPLTPWLFVFLSVPVALLASTISDIRERQRLARVLGDLQ